IYEFDDFLRNLRRPYNVLKRVLIVRVDSNKLNVFRRRILMVFRTCYPKNSRRITNLVPADKICYIIANLLRTKQVCMGFRKPVDVKPVTTTHNDVGRKQETKP